MRRLRRCACGCGEVVDTSEPYTVYYRTDDEELLRDFRCVLRRYKARYTDDLGVEPYVGRCDCGCGEWVDTNRFLHVEYDGIYFADSDCVLRYLDVTPVLGGGT